MSETSTRFFTQALRDLRWQITLIAKRGSWLAPPQYPVALAAAINRLLADPDWAEKWGQAAATAAEAYSWQTRAQTILTQVQQIFAGKAVNRI